MPGPVVGRAEVDVHADLSPFRRELNAAAARAGRDYGDTLARNIDSRLQRTSRIFDRFWGSTLRGSRNDFLNFVGVVSAGIERLTGNVIGRGLGAIGNQFQRLGDVIARFPSLAGLAKGFGTVGERIRGLGAGGIDGLIIQIGAMILAFNIGVNVMGFFAAALSTVAAGVTALAVGIGGALFGGLVALVPVVGALTVGIGALALGFTKLTKEQKAAFGPLNDLLKELRSGIQEQLFSNLGNQVDGLIRALQPLGPFLNSVAAEFSDWVSQVIGEIGPGGPLAATFESLGQSLPETFGRILDLLSNLGGSLVGLFDAATPAADRLLDGVNRILATFNEWVNSVAGQEAINVFLQQALDLLGSLYDIASEVGTALANLWTEGGADAAQVLLDNIRDIVAEFNTWVSDEGGREALLQWFNDGVIALQRIGAVLGAVLELFDALDTTFTRAGFQTFLTFLATAILWLGDMAALAEQNTILFATFATALLTNIGSALTTVGSLAQSAFQAFGDALAAVHVAAARFWLALQEGSAIAHIAVANALDAIVAALGAAVRFITTNITFAGQAFAQFGAAIQRALTDATVSVIRFGQRATNAFNRFVGDLGTALGRGVGSILNFTSRVAGALGRLVGRVVSAGAQVANALGRMANQAAGALGRFVGSIQRGINNAINALGRFVGRAVNALASLPGRFASLGASIMQGLLNGIVSRGSQVLNYLRNLAATAASTFASILRIGSPSKIFEEFGRNIVEGLIEGIDSGIGDVMASTNSLADAASFPVNNTPVSGLAEQSFTASSSAAPARSVTEVGGITIVTPYANPRLVAVEVMDELAARGK